MSWPRLVALATIGLVLAGCATAGSATGSAASVTRPANGLTIYGAASLKGVLVRVADVYPASHPGILLTISTDSSAALEAKIEQGAPADVFLSADTKNPQTLIARGLADQAVPFATNTLTIVVPAANPGRIRSPIDLARAGVKIIAAGEAVPITTYANLLVRNLARRPGYPAGFAAAYEANVVSREDNVGAIVSKMALGEGDAGIVYVTDARASAQVATVDLPPGANVAATYAATVVKGSRQADAAQAFVRWLAGPDGQAILAEFGFGAPA